MSHSKKGISIIKKIKRFFRGDPKAKLSTISEKEEEDLRVGIFHILKEGGKDVQRKNGNNKRRV